jgi:GNAT superfamily N-acetyltransferase
MYYRMSASEYGRFPAADLPAVADRRCSLMHARRESETASRMLAYTDGEVVRWCGIGPRQESARLKRSRTIPVPDESGMWAVVCFLVRPGHRRRGGAASLLAGAVSYTRREGAPGIEGYPADTGGRRIDTSSGYVGTTQMFEAAGVRRVCETSARSAGLRWILRRDS